MLLGQTSGNVYGELSLATPLVTKVGAVWSYVCLPSLFEGRSVLNVITIEFGIELDMCY